MKATTMQIVAIMTSTGSVDNPESALPMVVDKPELTKAPAIAMPAPNRSRTPREY